MSLFVGSVGCVSEPAPQRRYQQDTSLPRALSSLFGLICALSDCPHTRFLRPMAHFHLPLSSDTETLVRTASLYSLQRDLLHLPLTRISQPTRLLRSSYSPIRVNSKNQQS